MSRKRKPTCYLEKYRTGYFGLSYTYSWIAFDGWGHEVARGKTQKECIHNASVVGYTYRR